MTSSVNDKRTSDQARGVWRRVWVDPGPVHRCILPKATRDGDLWQCDCWILWEVEAYRLSGVSPSKPMELRWIRARRRVDRIRYSRPVQRILGVDRLSWFGLVFALACGWALLGDRFGWWNLPS